MRVVGQFEEVESTRDSQAPLDASPGADAEWKETMTRSQWSAALVFGNSILLVGTAWRLYAEGFTWRVAVIALMAVSFLAGQIGHSRKRSPQP
jgi:hypothetical protein